MTTFAFAASPGLESDSDPDRHAFRWTSSFPSPRTGSGVVRPSTSGKMGSPLLAPLNVGLARGQSPLVGRGVAQGRSPRTSSLSAGSPVSPGTAGEAEPAGARSDDRGERLLPAFPLTGVDAFGPSSGWKADALRLEGFQDRFPMDYRRGSGSSYQSSSTIRSSCSSGDFDGLGLVGPGLSSLSLASDLSSASSPGPASPMTECERMALTPRLLSSSMPLDNDATAPSAGSATTSHLPADPFADDDDLSAFLQSLPAWHGSSAAIATKDFNPADDDFYWQDLEDSVQIDLDSCPATPRAASASLRASRHPYAAGRARAAHRSPGKLRRASSCASYGSRRSSMHGYAGCSTPGAGSVRSFGPGSPGASRSSLTLRQVPTTSSRVPPSPLAAGKRAGAKGKDKGKTSKVKKAKKVRPPLPEVSYTAEGFDAGALDAFFGIRAKAPDGVEMWRRGSASATAPLLGPEGDERDDYDIGRRGSAVLSSISTRLNEPESPRRVPPARLDIAAAQRHRDLSPDSRVFPMSAGVPRSGQRSLSPVPTYGRRQSEGGLLLGASAGSGKSRARSHTLTGQQRRLAEDEDHLLRKKASLGSKLMKALYGSEARVQEMEA